MFSNVIFLYPWILLLALLMPILWWIMRITPPRAKTIIFPAFFLLKDLKGEASSTAHAPWWMVLLRTSLLLAFIIAFSEPIINPSTDIVLPKKGTVLLVVDNNWASAFNWQQRISKVKDYINYAKINGNNVNIISTSKSDKTANLDVYGAMLAEEALRVVDVIKPQPWEADYNLTSEQINNVIRNISVGKAVFFGSGLYAPKEFLNLFDEMVVDNKINTPYLLKLNSSNIDEFSFTLMRAAESLYETKVTLVASDASSNILDELELDFPKGREKINFKWDISSEFRKRLSTIEVKGYKSAASTILFKHINNNYVAGVAINEKIEDDKRDLLSDYYYIREALNTKSKVETDIISNLLKKKLSVIFLSDSIKLTSEDKTNLKEWVENGGFLVRFAGPNLADTINN